MSNHESRELALDGYHENREYSFSMEPSRTIIERLGGEARVSAITDTSVNAPYRWQYPKAKGGTGGLIPQRYHRILLDYAAQNGIDLRAEDFLPMREVA